MYLQFRDLSIGERFVFAYGYPPKPADNPNIYTKVRGGRYQDKDGNTFHTGAKTAVADSSSF